MAKTIDPAAVAKAANTRPDSDEVQYEQGSIKKLGSRVTKKQSGIVGDVITASVTRKLVGDGENDDLRKALQAYADTGEKSYLSPEQSEALSGLVAQCRERAENESQARRYWPRKVAAIVVNIG